MQLDTESNLSVTTKLLHWTIALTVIGLLCSGVYVVRSESFTAYTVSLTHKSVGQLLFLLVLARVLWRFKNGWPKALNSYKRYEIILSKIVHTILLVCTVLMPLSGFLMSAMGGYGVHFFGLEAFPANLLPEGDYEFVPVNAWLAEVTHWIHIIGGYTLFIAILLHITGALKHHFIDKDITLRRMSPFNFQD